MTTKTRRGDFRTPTVVAWQGASYDREDGAVVTVSLGDELPVDDPAVKRLGRTAFVEADTPRSERPTYLDEAIGNADARAVAEPERPPRIDLATPLGDLWEATSDILDSTAGPCRRGRKVATGDPLLEAAPEHFRPLWTTLGD